MIPRGFDEPSLRRDAEWVARNVLKADFDAAREAEAPASIAWAKARLDAGEALDAQAAEALKVLEALEANTRAAEDRHARAVALCDAGTIDETEADAREAELRRSAAAVRHWAAQLPAAFAAVSSPLHRIAAMQRDRIRTSVFAETDAITAALFSKYDGHPDSVASRAHAFGQASDAAAETIWPIAEVKSRRAFVERAKELKHLGADTPPLADLDRAFAARRAGLEATRARARAALAELG